MLYRSRHIRLERVDGIATLWFDSPDGSALSLDRLRDLESGLATLRYSPGVELLLIRSADPAAFLVGPDWREYDALTDVDSRRTFSRTGQDVLQQLSHLSSKMATVALIDGECRDGGLELALACDFRLAIARPETRLAFDFASRGMLPCWGATQRLPRLIGPKAAVNMLVRGQSLLAREAKKIGLVDHAFGNRPAKTELWWFLADVQDRQRRRSPRPWWTRITDHPVAVEHTLFGPAIDAMSSDDPVKPILDAMRQGWRFGSVEGMAAERTAFAMHDANMAGVMRQKQARWNEGIADGWLGGKPLGTLGLLNLGGTGVELAIAAMAGGARVSIRDKVGLDGLQRALRQAVDRGWMTVMEAEQRIKQLATNPGEQEWDDCDAIFLTGNAAEQASTMLDLDSSVHFDAALVVTSGSIPLHRLARRLVHPERVVSIDFEASTGWGRQVVLTPTLWTNERTLSTVYRWLHHCGQRPQVKMPPVRRRAVTAAA